MIRSRLLPSLAALVLVSIACFVGCGGTCDGDVDACTACDNSQTTCLKACTTQECKDTCGKTRNDCYSSNCHFCG